MSALRDRLILASAGTGKTYQLSGRYVALLLAGAAPRAILASTFTRKAAGEIQDRVLRRLAEAALDPAALAELRAQIAGEVEGEITAERCLDALERLARELHRVRIATLDAFLVGLGRVFALDLGLPPDWTIVDEVEDRRLRAEAAALALAESDELERVELLRALHEGDLSRRVESLLLATAQAGREACLESDAEAWAHVRPRAAFDEEDEARVRSLVSDMRTPRTKAGAENKSWAKAHGKLLSQLERRCWAEIVKGNGLVKKVRECERTYAGGEITDECSEVLVEVLELCAARLLAEVALRNRATRTWIERFEGAYRRVQARERGYRFADLPALLAPPEGDPLRARGIDLAFRLDGRIDHLLLDEFQDTSTTQWRVLARLAEEITADAGRSFFCVGDVKQSIYGWRHAEPRLLETLHERLPALAPESLDVSWRSSPVVLRTVNRVFGSLRDNAALAARPEHVAAAEAFQRCFRAHEAAPGREAVPGFATLVRAPAKADGERKDQPALVAAADRVAEILRAEPEATVGVLVRSNQPVNFLILLLRARGVPASGEGGTPLTDSAAVLAALSLVHLADHPGDLAAAFHAATSPLGSALGLAPGAWRDERPRAAREVRRRLAEEGYGPFLASLLPLVRAGYDEWNLRRSEQLVELGHQHDARASLRPDDFVALAHEQAVEDPTPAQVRVMTVHKAKGLEFDAVVLPQLDGLLARGPRALLLDRPDPHARIARASVDPGEDVCRLDEQVLRPLWSSTVAREVRESLSLLYVAMTRARHRLDMIVADGTKGDARNAPSFGRVLVAALAPEAEGEGEIWREPGSGERWLPPRPRAAPAAADEDELPRELALAARPASPRRARASASALAGGGVARAAELLAPARGGGRARGSLVHRYLEACAWVEDLERAEDGALLAAAADVEPDLEARRATLAWLRERARLPAVRAALARPEDADELEVWRERRFAVALGGADGGEELWSGAFDRVVLRRAPGGGYAHAELLDYKTDTCPAGELEGLVERYRPQLEAYRRCLAAMTGLPAEAVGAKLVFLSSGEVVNLLRNPPSGA